MPSEFLKVSPDDFSFSLLVAISGLEQEKKELDKQKRQSRTRR